MIYFLIIAFLLVLSFAIYKAFKFLESIDLDPPEWGEWYNKTYGFRDDDVGE